MHFSGSLLVSKENIPRQQPLPPRSAVQTKKREPSKKRRTLAFLLLSVILCALFAKGDGDGLHLTAARDGDLDGVTGLVVLHQGAKVALGGNLAAVYAHDAVTGLQARLVGRAALDYLHDVDTVGVHAQLGGGLGVGHGKVADAQIGDARSHSRFPAAPAPP